MEQFIQIATTADKRETAEKIATELVGKRLAGCVQISGPVVSTYQWKGRTETAQEWLCTVKTRQNLYMEVEKTIKAIHPYETPEIIAIPIIAGSEDYLAWLNAELIS
jgi:periplasmic divalent cation tolerance protein